jgi:hypothetical protein
MLTQSKSHGDYNVSVTLSCGWYYLRRQLRERLDDRTQDTVIFLLTEHLEQYRPRGFLRR